MDKTLAGLYIIGLFISLGLQLWFHGASRITGVAALVASLVQVMLVIIGGYFAGRALVQ